MKHSTFGFTNTSDGTHPVTPTALGLTTNYATASEDATTAILNNKTAPLDAEELIRFTSRPVANIQTGLHLQYPSPIKGGLQYQVEVQDVLTTTDDADPAFRVDEPIVAMLSIRHPKSGNFNNDVISTVLRRLIGCVMRADGTWRFDDLMRSAEKPVVD
jgi:hypothetical protein